MAQRQRSADGTFVYSVATTGIYCRPSCGARRPRPENVAFHASPQDAERAGFRACKRCKPRNAASQDQASVIAAVCRRIDASDSRPAVSTLAAEIGWSVSRFHRAFRHETGMTPRGYMDARRAESVRSTLPNASSITQAIYDAGFNSSGRFYEQAPRALGMTPSTFRKGGLGERVRFALGESTLGALLVAATDRGICGLSLGDDPQALLEELQARFHGAELVGGDAAFERLVAVVAGWMDQPGAPLRLPLDVRGTVFQRRVWRALVEIPVGETATYAQIAGAIGKPTSTRAVARACAANEIAIAIPCHRVVRQDGSPSGYRWGLARKQLLLRREAAESVPVPGQAPTQVETRRPRAAPDVEPGENP